MRPPSVSGCWLSERMETLLDHREPEVRVDFGFARAEFAMRAASRAFADQIAAIDATLVEARAHPEVFLGPRASASNASDVEFAERSVVADLAVRLSLSENTVRAQAYEAKTLRTQAPRVWAEFREGNISTPNAAMIAELSATLPAEAWAVFEHAVLEPAMKLAPARFRARARATRERVQPRQAIERHQARAAERRVWLDGDIDGMCWFGAYLPADVGQRAIVHVDRLAAGLVSQPDETRTLAQLRADVVGDLLAGVLGACGEGAGTGASVSVAVTVPVMTLLGRDEEPGILDGYGPIDADTARMLAAHAPSFIRILTHPISSTVLDVDRTHYRVPADLKRWLAVSQPTCTFPGCGRRSAECDIDHTIAWEHGGPTRAGNLAHLCRGHHRLKHNSNWNAEHTATGLQWTSPTGAIRNADPPPF
ncbi:MAG: HNH endonuclease [Salinibacterium sp.]|nr:MAG: HNH endonuclease [Salinibacterium sp.]